MRLGLRIPFPPHAQDVKFKSKASGHLKSFSGHTLGSHILIGQRTYDNIHTTRRGHTDGTTHIWDFTWMGHTDEGHARSQPKEGLSGLYNYPHYPIRSPTTLPGGGMPSR